ncbi:hypothetical protein, partial [Streptomyces sp. NPDC060022]|uniref:hypothetical protein n=1 Tax=Streptomyces sp. NPDC060022 TaxID=3347039 RepID=UPI00368403F5
MGPARAAHTRMRGHARRGQDEAAAADDASAVAKGPDGPASDLKKPGCRPGHRRRGPRFRGARRTDNSV